MLDILRAEQAPATFLRHRPERRSASGACCSGSCARATRSAITPSRIRTSPRSRGSSCGSRSTRPSGCSRASIGRRSLLFRPPYAEDMEPETPDQVEPLVSPADRGIHDRHRHRSGRLDGIPASIASSGPRWTGAATAGAIVLLHDGGGDRTQTAEALPAADWGAPAEERYQLVTVSELMGLTRDAVMPPVPSGSWFSLLLPRTRGSSALGSASAVLLAPCS